MDPFAWKHHIYIYCQCRCLDPPRRRRTPPPPPGVQCWGWAVSLPWAAPLHMQVLVKPVDLLNNFCFHYTAVHCNTLIQACGLVEYVAIYKSNII